MNATYQAMANARITATFAATICRVSHGHLFRRSNMICRGAFNRSERIPVTKSSNRLDHCANLAEFGAQVVHMDVDRLRTDGSFIAIQCGNQCPTFEYSVRPGNKSPQDLEFMRRKLDGSAVHRARRLVVIKLNRATVVLRSLWL